jgi:RimJ/RimL family protein N-acetyltransferase
MITGVALPPWENSMTRHAPDPVTKSVQLRDVIESDLPILFEHQRDPNANYMAAFTARDPTDRDAFMAHWGRILNDETITIQTILFNGQVAGSVGCYKDEEFGEMEITYWIGKEYWGKGVATWALSIFLDLVPVRPLYGRAAKDNIASLRVMQKCGFIMCGEGKGFAYARGKEVEEYILKLEASETGDLPGVQR